MRSSTVPAWVLLRKGWALLAVSLLLLPGAIATGSSPSLLRRLQDAAPSMGNIISTDPDLTTLAATLDMLTANGALADLLLSNSGSNNGGITLLAPTNVAFAAIAGTTVGERVLTTGSGYTQHLENLLALHFFPTVVRSADLITTKTGTAWTMANGETVTVGDGPSFTGPANDDDAPARLVTVTKELLAANGVVHKIDTVLLPEFWNVDVVTFAETTNVESLSTVKALLSTVQQQNPTSAFVLRLAKRSEVTLFAPTNEAFDEQGLLDAIEQQVNSGDDTSFLFNVIQNHVVLNTVLPMNSLVDGYEVSTMRNGPLKVETLEDEKVLVGGSLILDFILVSCTSTLSSRDQYVYDEMPLTSHVHPFLCTGQQRDHLYHSKCSLKRNRQVQTVSFINRGRRFVARSAARCGASRPSSEHQATRGSCSHHQDTSASLNRSYQINHKGTNCTGISRSCRSS
jgi:uncharacterized surface protein with fasciclin (FAS1) repeats